MVINDRLNNEADYVRALKAAGCRVVNFEDLGPGAAEADLVVNALYDQNPTPPTHLVGPDYFCLRDEFVYKPDRDARESVERILVTFGGVDQNNLTLRTIDTLVPLCAPRGIAIDVVVGPGFQHHPEIEAAVRRHGYERLHVAAPTVRISDYMMAADLAVTSGGRTVLELATLRVPTLVICQNERETTHSFATRENGVMNLGLHAYVTPQELAASVLQLIDDAPLRADMRERLSRRDLTGGKRRVAKAIAALLEDT